jgi:serine/threonine-protein kinase
VEERYQSAAEMAADMERLLVGTSITSSQVSGYLRALFGEERITQKTRIPTLVSLNQQTAGAPQFLVTQSQPGSESGARPLATPAAKPKGRLDATAVVGPPPSSEEAAQAVQAAAEPVKKGGSPRWLFPVVGLGLGALVAGSGILYGRMNQPAPVAVVQQPAAQPSPGAPVPPPPPQAAQPVVTAPEEKPAAPDAQQAAAPAEPDAQKAAVADVAPESAPQSANPEAAGNDEPTGKTSRKRLVTLDASDIQRVVNKGRGPILECFESFKEELPGEQGQVSVSFTILGSGKVTHARVGDSLGGSRVGRCLEQRVGKLRFPAHKDKEISLSLPFGYRIQR